MYLCQVARSKQPSAAAQRLIQELARHGLTVGYRAIEDWAARGLAPAPTRRSLGRGLGTVSEYPPGAADQYAAVASVMRRGLPWQVSVLKLLVRGYLPTNENLVRQAFHDLLTDDAADPVGDALDYAERLAAQAAASGAARPFLRAFRRNLRRAGQLLEPGTEIEPVVTGVIATLTLARIGEPDWSPDALAEMMAAFGLPIAEMASDDRAGVTRFADMFFTEVTAAPVLAKIAAETPLERIQSTIPQARQAAREAMPGPGSALPRPNEYLDALLTAYFALVLIRIEDLGGDQAMTERAGRAMPAPATSVP
jgi:hypothetical protein